MERSAPISNGQRAVLAAILIGFLALATVYSLVTPLFEASDELWHYPMVQTIAENGFRLPVQDPSQPTLWRQEGSQPPLYYYLGALATFWIDTSDLLELRKLNPHADIGVVVPDGNANMVMHSPEREGFPWSGAALAMRIVRFLSVLMGLGTVYLTYRLGAELFPTSPAIALGAAAFTAFNPMFLFISGVINNDNLSTLLASLLLVLVVRLVRWRGEPPLRFYVLLGMAAGAGMLAKFQIGFMLPLIALALAIVARRERSWQPLVVGGAISGGLTIAIAGWWYWRNYQLYGDATGINVFLDIVGRRQVPADLRQLWTERETFMMAFWGFFGGVNVPLPGWAYTVFNTTAALAVGGLIVAAVRRALRGLNRAADASMVWARCFAAIWPVVIFLSLLSWTRQTWASQGRLWFSAIAALSVWMAVAGGVDAPRDGPARRADGCGGRLRGTRSLRAGLRHPSGVFARPDRALRRGNARAPRSRRDMLGRARRSAPGHLCGVAAGQRHSRAGRLCALYADLQRHRRPDARLEPVRSPGRIRWDY